MSELTWYFIFLAVACIAGAIGVGLYNFAEAQKVQDCVSAGGSWIDINPRSTVTKMGCVMK